MIKVILKKTVIFLVLTLALNNQLNFAQELIPLTGLDLPDDINVQIKPYGWVNLTAWYDTNQVIAVKEGLIFLAPAPEIFDPLGKNITDRGQFGMSAIQSIFGVKLAYKNWPCSDLVTRGVIEVDFIGPYDNLGAGLPPISLAGTGNLRYAFVQILKPQDYSILLGLFYNPLFVIDCYPHTLNYERGALFEPQARNPQIRLTKDFGSLKIILAALAQRDFVSPGPLGLRSIYQRNSMVPNFHAQIKKYWGLNLAGAAIDYKRLLPRLVTDKDYKTDSTINSIIAEVYGKIVYKNLFVRSKIVYSQNGADHALISGYGVEYLDPVTDIRTYENTRAISWWLDSSYILKSNLEIGVFMGYAKKLNNNNKFFINPITNNPIIYELIPRLDSMFKIAPRIFWAYDPIRFGFEISYSKALYGQYNNCANLFNLKPSSNWRFLGTVYYLF